MTASRNLGASIWRFDLHDVWLDELSPALVKRGFTVSVRPLTDECVAPN